MLTKENIFAAIPMALDSVELPQHASRSAGKVRDIYHWNSYRILITTDRFSAFDRILGLIPFKGQILNQLSVWWFEQTRDIVANHLVAAPDPNVMVVREAEALPVEVVVRGYITGVTATSLWTLYEKGERVLYGVVLPDGLRKNDRLPTPLITPTTKAVHGHDAPITPHEIVSQGVLSAELWEQIEKAALAIFARGMDLASQAGLVLVDTKYEFGLVDGQLTLIDEVHTPDSSRYWMLDSGTDTKEPENYDKEFLRRWLVLQGYRGEGEPPTLPNEIIVEAASRYMMVYERLTGQDFIPAEIPATERIAHNIQQYRESSR